ncbi:MAG: PASTA domain-containing protein [Myxococcales bacterium]|nr:PASTA domain-containing protein [Myxococcales bacterium]
MSHPHYQSNPGPPPAPGGGTGSVLVVSFLTSAVISMLTVYAVLRWAPPGLLPAPQSVAAAPAGVAGASAAPAAAAPGAAAVVPDVVGLKVEAADELLTGRGLRLLVQGRRSEPNREPGIILEQTPLAQSRMTPGQQVSVVIAEAAGQIAVPVLMGQPLEAAKASLQAAGLVVGQIGEAEGAPPGQVMATAPAAGTPVSPGQIVSMTVGKTPTGVQLPSLRGMSVSAARAELAKLGLKPGRVSERYESSMRAYLVLSHDPPAGSQVELGSKVDLVVNEGD